MWSTCGRRSVCRSNATMRGVLGLIWSPLPEDDAVAAVGVGPGQGALAVAHHVAGAALETLLIVEQDPAVGGKREEVRRARGDAGLGRARTANLSVDDDVRSFGHPELHGCHAVLESHDRQSRWFDGGRLRVHRKILPPSAASLARSRQRTPWSL